MPGRIRTIKPEVLEDEKASALSDLAWRLWVSSWLLADDWGNLRAGVRYLAAQVWQDTARADDAEQALCELQFAGLVNVYAVADQRYCAIAGWDKHQRVDHRGKQRVPGPNHPDAVVHCKVDSRDFRKVAETFGESPQVSESCGKKMCNVTEEEILAASRVRAFSRASDLRPPTSDLRPPTNEHRPRVARDASAPHPEPAAGSAESGVAVQSPECPPSSATDPSSDPRPSDDSLPIPEPKTPGKGKRVPRQDLAESELPPEAVETYQAIVGDESLAPIVALPRKLAVDLVRAGPGLCVPREVAKAGAWLRANPARAKKNGAAFLLGWVTRAQERGGGRQRAQASRGYPVQQSGIPGYLEAVIAREQADAERERAERLANTPDDGLPY